MNIDKEIENLKVMLLKMADTVQQNISESFGLYRERLPAGAMVINDDIVDHYERLIEEISLNIILKERPYAGDLRIVTGILKMVADLERIGDHAEDIFIFNNKLQKYEKIKNGDIDEMVAVALSMVTDSIKSFVKEDIELARQVIARDDKVDDIYQRLLDRFVDESTAGKISSGFAIYSTLVVKYIERIADHAQNIAEWVIYIISGYHKDGQIF